MPLNIIRTDITTFGCDAIVIPTDSCFSGSGSMDYQIRRLCGAPLTERLNQFKGLRAAQAICVGGFNSNAKHIIFVHGPVYENDEISAGLLKKAYFNCLTLALEQHCQSIAMPLISSGTFGYPKDKAYRIACESIREYLNDVELDVTLVLFDDESCQIAASIEKKLDISPKREMTASEKRSEFRKKGSVFGNSAVSDSLFSTAKRPPCTCESQILPLNEADCVSADEEPSFEKLDEGFQKTLFKLIDEKKMSDVEVYKKANLDKRLFSKIRSNENYHPKKETVLAFAIALKLTLKQTRDLLNRAGYSLSRSLRLDAIVESFIRRENYDIDQINLVLFEYDQPLLGAK